MIGREAEIAQLARAIESAHPFGAVISGVSGVGKTTLAREALALADARGFATVWLSATPAARGMPFAVFACLGVTDVGGSPSLGTARRAILDAAGGRHMVVFVDDAQHLDGPSALVLWQLADESRISLVATVRRRDPMPDELMAILSGGSTVRVDLAPLDKDAVTLLCADVLGGEVDPVLAAEVARLTGGLPLFVRELLVGAATSGLIAPAPVAWMQVAALDVPERVVDLVTARMQALGSPLREALELVTLGEPLPLGWLLEAYDDDVVQQLIDARLVEVRTDAGDRSAVWLGHPLSGDVLLRVMPEVRRRRSLEFLAARVDPATCAAADRVRAVQWSLATDAAVSPATVAQAASDLVAVGDYRGALGLAEIAWREAPNSTTGQLLGFVAKAYGLASRADEVLGQALADATTDQERTLLTISRSDNLSSGLLRTDDAIAMCRCVDGAIADPVWSAMLAAQRAALELERGNGRASLAVAEPLLSSTDPRVFVVASYSAAVGLAFDGRALDALECSQRAYELHRELQADTFFPFEAEAHLIRVVYGLLYGGRIADADAVATQLFEVSLALGVPMAIPLTSLGRGLVEAERGRLSEAAEWFTRSAQYFRSFGLENLRPWALGSLLRVLARLGRIDAAHAVLTELSAPSSLRFNEAIAETGRAWVAWREGRVREARSILLDTAASSDAAGNRTNSVLALHDLALLGFADVAAVQAADLVPQVQGPLLTAKLEFVAAVADRDLDALVAVAEAFGHLGAWLAAAEAFGAAAVCATRAGSSQRAAQLVHRARRKATHAGGFSVETLADLAATPALTAREHEVARLAAAGHPSKRIAADLGITRKTVDNLLARAYGKLGVSGRGELATLFGAEALRLSR